VFIFDAPPHRCADAVVDGYQSSGNLPWSDVLPWIPREQGYPSKCSMVDFGTDETMFLNHTSTYFNNIHMQERDPDLFTQIRRNVLTYVENSPHKSCDSGWTYNHDLVFPTIVSQNDWVCEEDWRPMVIQTVFWVGNTVGCFVWGFTNDRFGRKPTVLLTHGIYCIAGILTLCSQNMVFLCICRFLVGSAHHTVSHLPYLLVIEYCGVKTRIVPLLMMMVSYSLASMTIPWIAMALPSWQYLAVLAPAAVLPVLFCWKVLPESPSWLLVVGREEDAIQQLKIVAKINGNPTQDVTDEWERLKERDLKAKEARGLEVEEVETVTLLDLFKTPNLRVNALLVNVICMMGFMCYYGHVQNTRNLGNGNEYKSYFLGALAEIPCWSIPFIINKFGRRWPLLTLFFTSGVCGVLYGFIPVEWYFTSLTIALTGRMTVTAAYFICLQYGSEIFPTVIRGQGVAMCEILGGVAIFLSPSIVYLSRVSPILPLLILGLCSLVGATATFWLPETAGYNLPQTLEEGRTFGDNQSKWDFPCSKKGNRYVVETKLEQVEAQEQQV